VGSNMNKPSTKSSQRQRSAEVYDLVTWYKQQRSVIEKGGGSSSSNCDNLSSLNITPWDYSLDANICIKTEKDLALDTKYFGLNFEPELHGQNLPPKEYFEWLRMQSIHGGDQNSVSFASLKTDASSYEEQYLSLKIFLAACNSSYKRELSGILLPIFIHFYLDLISKPDHGTAKVFYTKFSHDHDEQHKELVQNMSKITSSTQVSSFTKVRDIRENKTSLKLSPQVYLYLLQHLRHGNYTLVLQTLNRHFSIKNSNVLSNNKCTDDVDGNLDDMLDVLDDHYEPLSAPEQQGVDDLRKSIAELHSSSKVLQPSICLYSFTNAYQGLSCASFSHNGCSMVSGSEDSAIRLWNIMAPNKSNDIKSPDTGILSPDPLNWKKCQVLRGHTGIVYQARYIAEDTHLLSASQDKTVRVWNVATSAACVEYRGHDHTVWDVAALPSSTYFCSASLDKTLRLWNTEYAFPLRIFAGHNDSVDCCCFHPNGNYIATGSSDKSCRLWDLQTGQFVRVFVGHKSAIHALSFTKDGKYLVSGGEDCSIMVWDISNGQLLNEIRTHSKTIYSLAFSGDGAMLASSGLDACVKVWDSETLFKKGVGSSTSLLKANHEVIGSYPTNSSCVLTLKFSTGNLLLAACLHDVR